ncbi:MAG TPA: NTP transferase domain-containing protein [Gammaproteobacteria bacterium]|nr:NTP transferase domain-containing protein [Gammaproteobacteria bacterium]
MDAEDGECSTGIVVLATDARVRLRRNRRRARFHGKTRLWQALDAALASPCRPVIVVLGARDAILRDEIATTNEPGRLKVVVNWAWQEGVSSSIRQGLTALEASPREVDSAIFMRTWLAPPPGAIKRLLAGRERARDRPVVASRYEACSGLPALFDRRLFPELMRLRGGESLARIIRRYESKGRATYGSRRDEDAGFQGRLYPPLRHVRGHELGGSARSAAAR